MSDSFSRELRHAVRSLLQARGFTATALVTLAVGIGANAAVFSVLKSVLIDSLPYRDAERLVRIYGRRLDGTQERSGLSAGVVRDIRARQSSFVRLAAFVDSTDDAVYAADDSPQIVSVTWVEPGFFDVLGVAPSVGRLFRADESGNGLVPLSAGQLGSDTATAVIISHGAAERMFGTGASAVGRTVRINGVPRTIVGVVPANFAGPFSPVGRVLGATAPPSGTSDFYLPFNLQPVADNPGTARSAHWLAVVGRLKDSTTSEAAAGEVEELGAALAREHPDSDGGRGLAALSLREALVGDTRTPLLVLMISAALVLLIACANLGGTLLSRMLARRNELAVRSALGASRGDIVRQLLTETTLVSLAGGAAGLTLAVALLRLMPAVDASGLPAYAKLSLDWGSVGFTALLAIATGLAFGLAPALSAARWNPQVAFAAVARGSTSDRRTVRLRGVLVAGEIALCVSLVMGAGLLGRSLLAMVQAPLGFDPTSVVVATIQLPPRDYATADVRSRLWAELRERLTALPGAQAVAAASAAPSLQRQRLGVLIPDRPLEPNDAAPVALAALVSDNYFRTLRIPLKRGRVFDARDRAGAPQVAVISDSMARRFWPGGDALGGRLRLGANPNSPLIEVVGIVGDVRNDRARLDLEPTVYRPEAQVPAPPFRTFLLRTDTGLAAIAPLIEREVRAIDRTLPVQRLAPLTSIIGERLSPQRVPATLMAAFGLIALLLAAVGVYAMFATLVAAREREFGLRMALGSRRRDVMALILRQGAVWMVLGLGLGAFGISAIGKVLRGLLHGIEAYDPVTFAGTLTIVVAAACAALLIPSYRAASVDPAVVLRAE